MGADALGGGGAAALGGGGLGYPVFIIRVVLQTPAKLVNCKIDHCI